MHSDVPHLALPLRFRGDRAATIEQDSDADVLQCVETVLRFRRGHLLHAPEFGVPDQAHRQGGADLAGIVDAVSRWEPRAATVAEDLGMDEYGLVQQVRVNVSRTEDVS